MNTKRKIWIGILLPLLSAGYAIRADAGPGQSTPVSPREGIVRNVEPKLVPVPDPSGRSAIEVWTNRGEGALVHPGQSMEVFFRTRVDAYVAIVDIDTRGRARLLYPTSRWDDGFVRAGRTVTLPGRRAGYRLMVTGPAGLETIAAFASDRPIAGDWEALIADEYGCLGCAEGTDLSGHGHGVAWQVALGLNTGNVRIELASGSSKPRITRDGLDPRLVPVPVTPCFLDRDETWFRVSRGPRHGW